MKIAVFCSANNNISREYFERTTELARWCREEGHTIVFGGCNMGLMGCLAEEKGSLVGVVPRIIEQGGRVSENLTVHIPCDNLSDRKDLMLAQADTAVALPGGIGTLDELFSVAASRTIGYHTKKIILYNINGFWDSLVHLLDDLQERGMIRGQYTDGILPVSTLQELQKKIEEMS